MPANMKKGSYKRGGSKMKKARRGTGNLPKANLGHDIGNWLHRAYDNTRGFVGNLARDVSDPFIAGIDYLGDADRAWVAGDKDWWNIRPDDYKYSERGWNKPGWKAGTSGTTPAPTPTPTPRKERGNLKNRQKWAAEETYVPQSQRRSRGGVAKKATGGHVVPGKFLRQGPTR